MIKEVMSMKKILMKHHAPYDCDARPPNTSAAAITTTAAMITKNTVDPGNSRG